MDDIQDQPVRGASASPYHESSSDQHDYSESDRESSDSDISLSGVEEENDIGGNDNGYVVALKENYHSDPNVNLIIGSYKIIARNEACSSYQCVNTSNPGVIYTASLVNAENKFNFLAIYDRIKGHPDINQIHEVATYREKSLVVYQKTGRDLHSYLCAKKKLPEPEAAYLFQQILKITIDLHRAGIIVRDLKIRKFCFRNEERKKLFLESWDDSLLLSDPENDIVIEKWGCPVYVSPEILNPQQVCYSSKKANCWSLGVILYAMLTNSYPFNGSSNFHTLFDKISRCLLQIPVYLSPLALSLIKGLLCTDPDARLSASEALQHEWIRVNCDNQMIPPFSPFGNLALPRFTGGRREEDAHNMRSNLQQGNILSSPASSGGSLREVHQPPRGVVPQESNCVPYPVFSQDQLVPTLSRANIDSPPSFISPQ